MTEAVKIGEASKIMIESSDIEFVSIIHDSTKESASDFKIRIKRFLSNLHGRHGARFIGFFDIADNCLCHLLVEKNYLQYFKCL